MEELQDNYIAIDSSPETSDSDNSSGTAPFDDRAAVEHRAVAEGMKNLNDCLRWTRAAKQDKAKKRVLPRLNMNKKRRRFRGSSGVKPTWECVKLTPADRVAEHPGQGLVVHRTPTGPTLFCEACKDTVTVKTCKQHLSTAKHQRNLCKLVESKSASADVARRLQDFFAENTDVQGAATAEIKHRFRTDMILMCLKAGLSLRSLRKMAPFLESWCGQSLGSVDTHAAPYLAVLSNREFDHIKHDIGEAEHFSIIFDGMTHLGEAFVVIARTVTKDFHVQQRLMSFELYAKSMDGEDIAAAIFHAIVTTYGLDVRRMIAVHRDRASANGRAVALLRAIAREFLDVGCFPHTLANGGKQFADPERKLFLKHYNALFKDSPLTKLLFKEHFGVAPLTICRTRWGSEWEVSHQVVVLGLGPIRTWLNGAPTTRNSSPAARYQVLQMLNNNTFVEKLLLQLAAVDDAGEAIVKAIYNLEGDGPLAFTAYETLQTVFDRFAELKRAPARTMFQVSVHLNVMDHYLPEGQRPARTTASVYREALEVIEPALQYISARLSDTGAMLSTAVAFFKAARMCNPMFIRDNQPAAPALDAMKFVPYVTDEMVEKLKDELPTYTLLCQEHHAELAEDSDSHSLLQWWRDHMDNSSLQTWLQVTRLVLHVQPSSAAAERAFSLFRHHISHLQRDSHEDLIQLRLQMQDHMHD